MRKTPICASLVLFVHLNSKDEIAVFFLNFDNLVTVNSAPGRYVIQCARVGADDLEPGALVKTLDVILGADHRHRAEQAPAVKDRFRHASFQ